VSNDFGILHATADIERLFPWWLVLLQGIVILILGIMFLTWPFETLLVMVTFLGAYWFVSGIFALIGLGMDRTNAALKAVLGILGIIAGILILIYPLFSTILVPFLFIVLIGVWGVIMGAVSLYGGIREEGWGSAVLGVIGIIFGIIILAHPFLTETVLPLVLGIFGIIGGISTIAAAFMVRPGQAESTET